MKTVLDKDGKVLQVASDTPCHAGKNGGLPVMLDFVLDAGIFKEVQEREIAWAAAANERKLEDVRAERRPLLNEADIQVNKHIDLNHENLSLWMVYRQALRDVTNQGDINNVIWPKKPVGLP